MSYSQLEKKLRKGKKTIQPKTLHLINDIVNTKIKILQTPNNDNYNIKGSSLGRGTINNVIKTPP